jgi:hypothetical protein
MISQIALHTSDERIALGPLLPSSLSPHETLELTFGDAEYRTRSGPVSRRAAQGLASTARSTCALNARSSWL